MLQENALHSCEAAVWETVMLLNTPNKLEVYYLIEKYTDHSLKKREF